VNEKNNTRRELSAENLRKTLMAGKAGIAAPASAFLVCTTAGAIQD
jgi:hypothetical protein